MNISPARLAVLITSVDPQNNDFGSGFVVQREGDTVYVITCAHVVEAVGGEDAVRVNGIPARVLKKGSQQSVDLALLQIEGLKGMEVLKLALLVAAGARGRGIRVVGYSREHLKSSDPPRLREIKGVLGGSSSQLILDQQAFFTHWDIEMDEGRHVLQPGYSGSPILGSEDGEVVGIVSHRLSAGREGYAISTDALRYFLPPGWQNLLPPPKEAVGDESSGLRPYLGRILEFFTMGVDRDELTGVIPFLGMGVGMVNGASNGILEMASTFPEKAGIERGDEDLIGVPCAVCPLKFKQWSEGRVPSDCPILQQIRRDDSSGTISMASCGLSCEQRLVHAKVNLRLAAQLYELVYNENRLYKKLRSLYGDQILPPGGNPVYEFLSTLPSRLRLLAKRGVGRSLPYVVILTTNIDEGLEASFRDHGQDYDLLYYIAGGEDQGHFRYLEWDDIEAREPGVIAGPDTELRLGKRPLIVKLFGTWNDRFAITEGHFVNYLSRLPVKDVLPVALQPVLASPDNQYLMLGFSLGDPDLELILRRFEQCENWAIRGTFHLVHQSRPGSLEKGLWQKRGVDMPEDSAASTEQCVRASLKEYIAALQASLEELETQPRGSV